jgi:signal transduction histidine kinase/CheY-like chemotaxis protein/AraC-like DNA-binding protein
VAGSGGEIIIYNVNSGKTDHREVAYLLPEKSNHRFQMFRCITEDRSGRIWIGGDAGLTRVSFNNGQPEFTAYHNKGTNGPIFRSTWIFCLYPDPRDADLLWIGTMSGGLARFNCKTEKVTYVSSEKNPGFDIVSGVVADNKSNLWLSTNKGLYQYQIPTDVFVDYSKISHIPKLDINAGASILTDAGLILLGTTNGMIEVNPRDITSRDVIGNLVISNLAINRQSTDFAIAEGKISFDEKSQISLNLSYDDNYVSVGFSIPTALNPASAQYRYKIEGLGNEWVYIGQTHNIEFSRLSPGRYLLEIQAVSGGQSWSDASSVKLPIHVSPPWYASNLAYILYLCLLTGLIWAGLKYQKNRLALQFKADLNQKEMERLQSMDDFKNRFFAYIAHEFKTPLTIIMGASEQLKRAIPGGNTGQYQEAIIREGNNMLGLINEMIDVTRLQDKSIKPHYDHRDMVEFLKGVTESHRPLTDLNQISLEFGSDSSTLLMDMDPLRTQYILNNLLSNAIQHTPAGGRIRVELQKSGTDKVMIRVVDNGTGISQEDLPNIFEKYFRAEGVTKDQNNFGLGLSFVRELTDLLHGSITVESVPGAETAFILILPARAPMGILVPPSNGRIDFQPNVSEWVSNVKPPVNAPQLLVVDDNPAIQSYLKLVLQPHFRLLIAKNGQEGLDIAIQEIPDLILTDVMMPVMDGIEMTNRLKSHQLTSHIPVVMLSAKNEIADRIKGQEQGADLYMGKPFNDQELILAIHNLNELQKKWKERYATVYTGTSSLEAAPDMPDSFNRVSISNNDAFMQRVLGTFEKNYANEKFDAVEIAALLNISKAQLYRKLSQISEESVMGMLRNYRLEKAVELIEKEPDMSIKEVAFKVGFKEYSHFSASFKKQFNIAPSEWRKFRMKD